MGLENLYQRALYECTVYQLCLCLAGLRSHRDLWTQDTRVFQIQDSYSINYVYPWPLGGQMAMRTKLHYKPIHQLLHTQAFLTCCTEKLCGEQTLPIVLGQCQFLICFTCKDITAFSFSYETIYTHTYILILQYALECFVWQWNKINIHTIQ